MAYVSSFNLVRVAACAAALSLAACGDDDNNDGDKQDAGDQPDGSQREDAGETDAGTDAGEQPDAAPEKLSVSLDFQAVVGDAPFQCGTAYQGLGTSSAAAVISDLRFYVYDLRLVDADGAEVPVELDQTLWQLEDAALLDFENMAEGCSSRGDVDTNTTLTGKVPAGDYKGFAFKVGLPPKLNHSNFAESKPPLDLVALNWSWNAGRVFFNLDATTVPAGEGAGLPFPVHVGSGGCTGNAVAGEEVSCARRNVAEIKLPTFELDSSKVSLDLAALLAPGTLDGDGKGCMSMADDPDCAAVFPTMGIDPVTGGASSTPQTVFSVVAK